MWSRIFTTVTTLGGLWTSNSSNTNTQTLLANIGGLPNPGPLPPITPSSNSSSSQTTDTSSSYVSSSKGKTDEMITKFTQRHQDLEKIAKSFEDVIAQLRESHHKIIPLVKKKVEKQKEDEFVIVDLQEVEEIVERQQEEKTGSDESYFKGIWHTVYFAKEYVKAIFGDVNNKIDVQLHKTISDLADDVADIAVLNEKARSDSDYLHLAKKADALASKVDVFLDSVSIELIKEQEKTDLIYNRFTRFIVNQVIPKISSLMPSESSIQKIDDNSLHEHVKKEVDKVIAFLDKVTTNLRIVQATLKAMHEYHPSKKGVEEKKDDTNTNVKKPEPTTTHQLMSQLSGNTVTTTSVTPKLEDAPVTIVNIDTSNKDKFVLSETVTHLNLDGEEKPKKSVKISGSDQANNDVVAKKYTTTLVAPLRRLSMIMQQPKPHYPTPSSSSTYSNGTVTRNHR